MSAGLEVESLLAPDRTLRPARATVVSALPAGDEGARYDRRAAAYDRLIASPLYNRLAWGTSPSQYAAFAAEAVAAGSGRLLDAGCGTATLTAAAYGGACRPLVLIDRSLDMLERAARRLADAPAAFVQADLLRSAVLGRSVRLRDVLRRAAPPRGSVGRARSAARPVGTGRATLRVDARGRSRRRARLLSALRRAGEVARPRRAEHLADAAQAVFGAPVDIRRTGSMAWLRAVIRQP